jgi:hypothetical protein
MIDWTAIAAQVPVVAVFIWFSLEINKRNQISMDKRDAAYLAVLAEITNKLEAHDVATKTAIARMEERTRPHTARERATD